jgi:hypothetical protein
MTYFACGIVLSSFLLFQVEPMIAKYILPWFGGSTAVWTTVMLFFQILLTGGYAYAHWLAGPTRRREATHLLLLGFSVGLMFCLALVWKSPITPDPGWKPQSVDFPVRDIFLLLGASVGLPFFLLATNSPWMQARFNRVFPATDPYRLYALSNTGSLLALITYPLLVEPYLPLSWQGRLWSFGFVVFALLAGWESIRILRSRPAAIPPSQPSHPAPISPGDAPAKSEPAGPTAHPIPVRGARFLWIALSACASMLLLATTNHITREVAVIPFLWILPLAAYLLSFILTFSGGRWYSRQAGLILLFAATVCFEVALAEGEALSVPIQLAVFTSVLFICCLVCHGELYRLRPGSEHLTQFYLLVSVGGALGGVIVNFIAPLVFQGYFELPIGVALCWVMLFACLAVNRMKAASRGLALMNNALSFLGLQIAILLGVVYIIFYSSATLGIWRNFYGVIAVKEQAGESGVASVSRVLFNGMTVHGYQFPDAMRRDLPTAYYGETSGVGLAIRSRAGQAGGLRVGVLGLGVGTLAAYGREGDLYRFYEINPVVIRLAEGEGGYFSYLADTPAKVEIIPGDARLSLEAELAAGRTQQYDILVLDVFSSDSIPMHLIDAEAFAIYLRQLRDDGILAVHISNLHLDLVPVAWTLADHFDLARALIDDPGDGIVTMASRWVLMARNPALLSVPAIASRADTMKDYVSNIPLWTDDFSNLFQILK